MHTVDSLEDMLGQVQFAPQLRKELRDTGFFKFLACIALQSI